MVSAVLSAWRLTVPTSGRGLRADLAGPVLDGLRWAYPYRLKQCSAALGDTVTIAISGPVTRTWQLVATAALSAPCRCHTSTLMPVLAR